MEEALYSFDAAIAKKHIEGHSEVTDQAWYVVLVAQISVCYEGLSVPEDFKFQIAPPNPEIMSCFNERMPPLEAAFHLFATRH